MVGRTNRTRGLGGALVAIGLLYLAFLGGAEGWAGAVLFGGAVLAVLVGGVLVWRGSRS
jgi:hypothetical protein